MRYLNFETLNKISIQALISAGLTKNDAEIVADVLLEADKLGIDSHGMNRLKPIYLDRIKDGILNPITKIDIIRETFTTAVLDANNGMGHVVSKKAMEMCIEKAKTYGMGMVAVRNSSHYGIAGYYGLMAAKNGMIGITGTNARPSIAPTFGVENMLGTNPLTFVMPSDEDFPFFLDCATSVSQRGKFEYYAKIGKDLPKGWVIDQNGESKTDAVQVLQDLIEGKAALTPLGGIGEETGGYKGYGYASLVEILSSALQGGAFMKALLGIENGKKVPYRLGHFFIAINIEAFIDLDEFKKTTGNILRDLRNSKKMPGQNRIYTAGEKEYEAFLERSKTGVPINQSLWEEIKNVVLEYKLKDFYETFEIID
ncbi:MAG: Ldh family oxidoreductase [Bacteroidales bacterium]|nr:Ldh family oxidoreductase [Bacteroidales bacterium]MCK9499619.1 Ldh family oxidoreductase [Bacteroidales bacterium]MDY0313734.1 Ldh family oxidoreductase [Bacteroidales bacterium]NLB86879.1 Ldh family oxidoreductase [Bacteroidales bacterium]